MFKIRGGFTVGPMGHVPELCFKTSRVRDGFHCPHYFVILWCQEPGHVDIDLEKHCEEQKWEPTGGRSFTPCGGCCYVSGR